MGDAHGTRYAYNMLRCRCDLCRTANQNYLRNYHREHYRTHRYEIAQSVKKYRAAHPEVNKRAIAKWAANNKEKGRAHKKLSNAIRKGLVVRPPYCQHCGLICYPHAHHPDYSKPLAVLWLCPYCHKQEHSQHA